MPQRSNTRPPLVFCVLFVLVGLVVAVWGGVVVRNAFDSYRWESTSGTIFQSSITQHRSKGTSTYAANIAYNYSVDGVSFTSMNIKFGQFSTSSRSSAEYWTKRYPVGKQVKVFYSPADHSQAVLERGVSVSSFFLLGVGSVFLVAGVYMLFLRFRPVAAVA